MAIPEKFVLRKDWGARAPKSTTKRPTSAVDAIFVHYTASDADEQALHRNCAPRVKGIQTFHMGPSRGWSDIAYNLLTCKHGWIFRGRGLGVVPAAQQGHNTRGAAICFLGDDTSGRDDVTQQGREAVARAVAHTFRWAGRRLPVKGHRDVNQTTCPGNQLYEWIQSDEFDRLVEQELRKLGGLTRR